MPAQFYYQVSSLPMLRFGEPAPMTPDAFTAFCRSQLPPRVADALERVALAPGQPPSCDTERQWQHWEVWLRNHIARTRAARLGADPGDSLRPEADVFPGDRRRVDEILGMTDPLARERELDRLRWRRLDDLAVEHDFDLAALVLYKLRLLLLYRWTNRTPEAGWRAHQAVVAEGLAQAADRRTATPAAGARGGA